MANESHITNTHNQSKICNFLRHFFNLIKYKRSNKTNDIELDVFNQSLSTFRRKSLNENSKNRKILKIIIDPTRKYYYYWICICFFVYMYNFVFIITRTSFNQLQQIDSWYIWYIIDYAIADPLYVIDIFFKFHTAYIKDGELCKDIKQIQKVYIKSINFKIDIISIIPLDFFYFAINDPYKIFFPALRLNKLLKFSRYNEFLTLTETKTPFPNLLRMSRLVLNILLLIHWNACIYFLISYMIGFGSDIWVYPAFINETVLANMTSVELNNLLIPNDLTTQYIYCIWWSTLTLTAIAEIRQPNIHYEEIYTSFLLLLGLVVIAVIIGSTNSMFQNASLQRQLLQNKSDTVKLFLRTNKIDRELEKRTNSYMDYLWRNPNTDHQNLFLDYLPDELNRAIAMNIHMDTLKRVSIFQDCEPGVLRDLVIRLKLKLFSPGDYICRKGDIGREMYFIKTGKLEVVSEDGKQIFAVLNAGASFGEISILDIPGNKNGNKRTASIRSVGFSDLFQLTKDDLWGVLSEYPMAKRNLLDKGKALLRKDNLLDEELAEKIERRQQSSYAQLENLEVCFDRLNKRFENNFQLYTNCLKETKRQITFLENKIKNFENENVNVNAEFNNCNETAI